MAVGQTTRNRTAGFVVFGSICQGKPFRGYPIFDPQPYYAWEQLTVEANLACPNDPSREQKQVPCHMVSSEELLAAIVGKQSGTVNGCLTSGWKVRNTATQLFGWVKIRNCKRVHMSPSSVSVRNAHAVCMTKQANASLSMLLAKESSTQDQCLSKTMQIQASAAFSDMALAL